MLKIIFLLTMFSSVSVLAMTEEEIRSEIQSQMSQRHPDPPANFWTNLGPESVPVIKKLFTQSNSAYEQSWLIDGLAHFSDPSIATLLQSKIESSSNAVMKKKMLGALIQSQGEAAFDFVEPYLKDKNPHIRLVVAQGIKNYMSGTRANQRLTEYQTEEKESWVVRDLEKTEKEPKLKRAGSVFQEKPEGEPLPQVLSEKDWAGEWKGVYLTSQKTSVANATLTYQNKVWKVEIKLPKQSKYELKSKDLEVIYYQSQHAHWIEVRVKKEDSVFIAQRKAK